VRVPKPTPRKQRKRFSHRRDPAYQDFVRKQPCLLFGKRRVIGSPVTVIEHECWGMVEACHVKSRGAAGDDVGNLWAGCSFAHRQQHAWGIGTFERKWGVNLKAEAERLYAEYQRTTV
jgi:hypothetical protein